MLNLNLGVPSGKRLAEVLYLEAKVQTDEFGHRGFQTIIKSHAIEYSLKSGMLK